MDAKYSKKFTQISDNPREATKYVSDVLFYEIYPIMLKIRTKIHTHSGILHHEELTKAREVYTLCASQISKCFQTLLEIFKVEYHKDILLQESRQYATERLSWCINRLLTLEKELDKTHLQDDLDASTTSILTTPLYFVNWIDHTFEVLTRLANLIYKTDYKETEDIYNQWMDDVRKTFETTRTQAIREETCMTAVLFSFHLHNRAHEREMVDCVSTMHISLDELLLSAMTLARYCLPADQHIIKARCQVVLRETKTLLSELIEGDLDIAFKASKETLKLPIMPSNINVLIDVLKDVLYVLETNTNTALLSLLVHCFSNNSSPVDILKGHIKSEAKCSCHEKSDGEEDCEFVKEFDLYNERLLQIGSFAVSCSSDQNRILALRSGLASVEALDPYLVPGLLLSPESHHARLLARSWKQEVQDIRDSVFLIVDPAAFAEKSKQMMHQTLLEILKWNKYANSEVCQVINIGCVVHDFFSVYITQEPDALTQREKLIPLIADLNKVQKECKIVSNMLATGNDFVYDVNNKNSKDKVSFEQLVKRLKLLYTLVTRTNSLMHPKENDDQLFACEIDEPVVVKNITHTIYNPRNNTYVNSPKKQANMSRSIFARTDNIRSSTANFPLAKLTKHLKAKKCDELSFSMKIDELFNLSDDNIRNCHTENNIVNKNLESLRECSVLYYSPKKRASLRKAVLSKHFKAMAIEPLDTKVDDTSASEKDGFIDDETQLQITEILNQMHDMTTTFSGPNLSRIDATKRRQNVPTAVDKTVDKNTNVLRINVNDGNNTIARHIWKIPVNASTVEMPLDDSGSTNKSDVTTLERIKDIQLVENKLSNLKAELETSL